MESCELVERDAVRGLEVVEPGSLDGLHHGVLDDHPVSGETSVGVEGERRRWGEREGRRATPGQPPVPVVAGSGTGTPGDRRHGAQAPYRQL